ncbi:hypothetical protein EMCG_04961 [[Emmonsia] crescens]|uniref:Uncharacterized protein n=1 Tax=[Emmonsia] crescens TaxID=73230 RepID=A0A0G2HQM9_9EURO|nr:hypothetical protein EMCG_04961 [Emmonsia crescens UAMH 3008]
MAIPEVVRTLLEEGVDFHAELGDFGDAIIIVDFMGHDETVLILLDYRATINTDMSSQILHKVMNFPNELREVILRLIGFLRMGEHWQPSLS